MRKSLKDSKKIILFYEPSSGFGGSASGLANLINHLNREDFCPIVIIKNYGPQFNKIKDAKLIKLRDYTEPKKMSHLGFLCFFARNIFPEALKIYSIIKENHINLVHVNTSVISGTPAIIAAKLSRIPCICFIRQTKQLINREKVVAKLVNQFVIENMFCLEIYKRDIPETKLKLIYSGVDLVRYNYSVEGVLKNDFNLNSSPVVGLVGRIVEGKGQKEFILSAKIVAKTIPDVRFVIVGDAKGGDKKYLKEVKELVIKENLSENVIFTGWRDDIEDVISDMNILVQASSTFPESFGLTIIEAMALSKPVIATNIPGPSEIVLNGVTGFLVPPANPRRLAEATIEILKDTTKAKKFGEAGRLRVEQLFDIAKIVRKIEALYIKLQENRLQW